MVVFLKNVALVFIGLLLSLITAEIILQVYNPFAYRIKGESIILPANQEYRLKNHNIPGLDEEVIIRINSLGFRGEELPDDLEKHISIVAVGGSTTKCTNITDGKTWPDILSYNLRDDFINIWVNNAGLDGHSTYGHTIMLKDHISRINPKILLFLIGANDIERKDLSAFDAEHIRGPLFTGSLKGIIKSISTYSEVTSLMLNVYRYIRAKTKRLVPHEIDLEWLYNKICYDEALMILEKNNDVYAPLYKSRVLNLINLSRMMGSDPVLVTQPSLFGKKLSNCINNDLKYISVNDLFWQRLEIYNDVLRDISVQDEVFLIDLARDMPKNTELFYDGFHFTNKGAVFVGNYIYNKLKPHIYDNYLMRLSGKYSGHERNAG